MPHLGMNARRALRYLALGVAFALPPSAQAADIRMAVRTDVSSMDPHYHVYVPNRAAARHIFDALVWADPRGNRKPALAVSWQVIGDDIWEFKLRPGVKFHDGLPFTAEDVAFSLARAPHVPNSPSSYAIYTKLIARVEVIDPLTVRIHTKGPVPTLLADLEGVVIVSKRAAEASSPLTALLATYNAQTCMGQSNRGRWSNAAFDAALGKALRTLDDAARAASYAQAAEIAVAEMAVIPVYFSVNSWATRRDRVYAARGDETSLAMGLRPAK